MSSMNVACYRATQAETVSALQSHLDGDTTAATVKRRLKQVAICAAVHAQALWHGRWVECYGKADRLCHEVVWRSAPTDSNGGV